MMTQQEFDKLMSHAVEDYALEDCDILKECFAKHGITATDDQVIRFWKHYSEGFWSSNWYPSDKAGMSKVVKQFIRNHELFISKYWD